MPIDQQGIKKGERKMCHNYIKMCHRYRLQPLRLYSLISFFNLSTLLIWLLQFSMQGYNLLHELRKIMHSIWGYGQGFFSCRTSVAFKSASAVLWQSGTIILDSAKTLSCRGEVHVSDLWLLRSEWQTIFNNDFSVFSLSYMKRRKPLE